VFGVALPFFVILISTLSFSFSFSHLAKHVFYYTKNLSQKKNDSRDDVNIIVHPRKMIDVVITMMHNFSALCLVYFSIFPAATHAAADFKQRMENETLNFLG
jgi:hypothetical protein